MNNKFFKYAQKILIIFFIVTGLSFISVSVYLKYHPLNYGKYLENLLNYVNSYSDKIHVHAEALDFDFGNITTPLIVKVKNISIHDYKEKEIAKFPYIFANFKLSDLIVKNYIPHRFVIQNPTFDISLSLFKTEQDELDQKMASSIEPLITQQINSILSFLFNEFDFRHFHIFNASGKIQDFIRPIQFSNANLSFDINDKYVLSSTADIKLKKIPFQASLHSEWHVNDQSLPVKITLKNINPSQFKSNKDTVIGGLNLPMDIFFNLKLDMPHLKNGAEHLPSFIDEATYKIDAGKGYITLPSKYKAIYDIKNFTFSGNVSNDGDKFTIGKGIINLQNGASIRLKSDVSGLDKLISEADFSDFKSNLTATAEKFDAKYLKNYWPKNIEENARIWVTENILKGYAAKAPLSLEVIGSGKDEFQIKNLSSEFPVKDVTLRYLPNTPLVTDGSAFLTFTKENLYIDILAGHTKSAKAIGGKIKILGFTEEPTKFKIDVNVDAPKIPEVLKIIASPDFMIKDVNKITTLDVNGRIWGNIKVNFGIYSDLTRDINLQVKVRSLFENVIVRNIFPNVSLHEASGSIDATTQKVDLKISSKLNNKFPFSAKITQFLDEKTNPETLISANSTLDISQFWKNDFVKGKAPISAQGSVLKNGLININVKANLIPIQVDLPFFTYKKKFGEQASSELNLKLNGNQTKKINVNYKDQKNSLIKGSVYFNQYDKLKSAHISHLKIGKNNFKGNLFYSPKTNKYKTNINGKALDISGIFEGEKTLNLTTSKKKTATKKFKLDLSMKLNRLWLINNRSMRDFIFKGINIDENWEHMDISGQFGNQSYKTKLLYYPVKNKENVYNFMLTSPNGGDTLRVLKLSKNIEGGSLNIRGKKDNNHVTGNLSLRNFALNNESMLVKMAQITSISGIVDAISGKGLLFTSGEFPFEVKDDVLTLGPSFIKGPSLGVTTSGEYNQKTNMMNFSGTIVPFYSLNSLPGKMPLIGSLFRGENSGGFLSQSYKINGTLQKPEFSFPPASVLMPGGLKKLFH